MGQVIWPSGGGGGTGSEGCTATKDHLLAGYTAVTRDSDDEAAEGTMPERGDWTGTVGMNGTLAVPGGHHSGNGKVSGPAVTQRGAWGTAIGVNGSVVVPEGYHNGGGVVSNSTPVMGGQTINPAPYQQAVYCAGNYMNGHIVINPIPANFIDYTAGQVVFHNGTTGILGPVVPNYIDIPRYSGGTVSKKSGNVGYDGACPRLPISLFDRTGLCFQKTFHASYFKRIRITYYVKGYITVKFRTYVILPDSAKYYNGVPDVETAYGNAVGETTKEFRFANPVSGQRFLCICLSTNEASSVSGDRNIYIKKIELLP